MASQRNFYALLGDDENDDPVAIVATLPPPQPKAKPPPPASKEPVREAQPPQFERGRGQRGGRGGRGGSELDRRTGYGRQNQDEGPQGENEALNGRSYSNRGGRGRAGGYYGGDRNYRDSPQQVDNGELENGRNEAEGERGKMSDPGRGRRYGVHGRGFRNTDRASGETDEGFKKRDFDRRSGMGRGMEMKRGGAGQGNWGTETDQGLSESTEPVVAENEKVETEKKIDEETDQEVVKAEDKKEEEEDKEMTLDEYEKVLSEKRKALEALKAQERKVELDKDFESMQLVEKKKQEIDAALKVSEKEKGKKKEFAEKEEKSKKVVSINEFLKPADGGDDYSNPMGRRGRGRGRGGFRGPLGGNDYNSHSAAPAPLIEDPGHFPSLGGK